jgi:hypothetical protein
LNHAIWRLAKTSGAHFVNLAGALDKQLSATYSERANAAESTRYPRLAVTLRSVADGYMRYAERLLRDMRRKKTRPIGRTRWCGSRCIHRRRCRGVVEEAVYLHPVG